MFGTFACQALCPCPDTFSTPSLVPGLFHNLVCLCFTPYIPVPSTYVIRRQLLWVPLPLFSTGDYLSVMIYRLFCKNSTIFMLCRTPHGANHIVTNIAHVWSLSLRISPCSFGMTSMFNSLRGTKTVSFWPFMAKKL